MALPLNVFQTVAEDVPALDTVVYTAPTGYNSIVLLAQACNTDATVQNITVKFRRNSTDTEIVNAYDIPSNETLVITSGRLVLETDDQLVISGSSTNLKFIASILEALK